MKQRFYSKKDTWMGILFFIVAIAPMAFITTMMNVPQEKPAPLAAIISLYIMTFIVSISLLSIWLQTYYDIDNVWLYCRMGPFKKKILITEIRSVKIHGEKSKFDLGLSTDRILIKYKEFNDVSISPEDQGGFIRMLKMINPKIVVE